jgi:uncharacterized protein YndB with AHSA1/START domain
VRGAGRLNLNLNLSLNLNLNLSLSLNLEEPDMYPEMVRSATYVYAPYEEVWRAITRPEKQEAWYVAPCIAFGWEAGERVAWGQPDAPVIEGKLTRWEPAQGFSHTFEFTRFDEPASLVEWHLMPQGEVVWVEVKHHFEDDSPETQSIVTDGWTTVLARLKTLLETGEPMPWPEWEEGGDE